MIQKGSLKVTWPIHQGKSHPPTFTTGLRCPHCHQPLAAMFGLTEDIINYIQTTTSFLSQDLPSLENPVLSISELEYSVKPLKDLKSLE